MSRLILTTNDLAAGTLRQAGMRDVVPDQTLVGWY
jgi:hypothetical protein